MGGGLDGMLEASLRACSMGIWFGRFGGGPELALLVGLLSEAAAALGTVLRGCADPLID